MIDHILVDRSLENSSIDCRVVKDGEWVLTSDHFPIVATIGLRKVTPTETGLGTENLQRNDMVAWRKITNEDISRYQSHIETALGLSPYGDVSPNMLSDRITNISHMAAENSLPHNRFNKYLKPYRTADVKEAHRIARYNRRLWIAEGRPRGSNFVSYTNNKVAKARFRKLQRTESDAYMEKVFNDLDKAAGLDYRLFWRLLRSRQTKTKTFCDTLNVGNACYDSPEDVSVVSAITTRVY